jgi:two-component system NtrC family sensor kinase
MINRSFRRDFPLTVLVVDDELPVCDLIKEVLSEDMYLVETAQRGEEALYKLQKSPYDIIITDILMPGMNGLELIKKAKKLSPRTVFLVITGHGKLDYAIQAMREGAADFLVKPFQITDLETAIKSSLEKKWLEEEYPRLQTLISMLEVGKDITSTLELNKLLERVLSTIEREFGFQHILIHLISGDNNELVTSAQHGYSENLIGRKIEMRGGVIATIIRTGKVVRVEDIDDIKESKEYLPNMEGAKSVIAVPIMAKDKVIGALTVESHQPRYFIEDDEYLLSILANQVGIAIENARLYQQLSVSRNRLITLFDAIPDNISLLDLDYTIIMANKATVRCYQTNYRELLGKKCYVIYRNRDIPCEHCPAAEVLRTKKSAHLDYIVSLINDERAHVSAYPVLDSAGELKGIIKYERIVTEQERLEKRLIQAEKLAALGEMAASLGHELNNYLNGIYLYSQRLPYIIEDKDKSLSSAKIIGEYVEKMSLLTRAMMDFGRLETHKQICQINDIIINTLNFLKPQNKYDHIEFVLDLDKRLPHLMVDPNQMQQVLVNVLNNAAEAMGQGTLFIKTYNLEEEDSIRITIMDKGPGIPEEFLHKIFEPHFTTKEKGYGFGLAICYRIVQNHQGRIEVDSQIGQGTRVNITLPAASTEFTSPISTDFPRIDP